MPLATLAIAALFVECALRLTTENHYAGEQAFVQSIRIRSANTNYVVNRRFIDAELPTVRLRTDDRSYYLPSRRFEDPDRTVVFFGGSTTECAAVQEEFRFPALVSKLLEHKGHRVDTLNIALSGNTVHDSINVLLNHVTLDKPDVAVMMHASNDIGLLRRDPEYRSRMARPLGRRDALFAARALLSTHSYFISRIRYTLAWMGGMGIQPRAQRAQNLMDGAYFPERPFRARLRAFIALARALGTEPVLMTQPYGQFTTELTPEWKDGTIQERANDLTRAVAAEEGVLVIDLMAHLQRSVPDFNEPMRVFYDAIHVTDEGSKIYARHIANALEEKLFGGS